MSTGSTYKSSFVKVGSLSATRRSSFFHLEFFLAMLTSRSALSRPPWTLQPLAQAKPSGSEDNTDRQRK